MSEGFCIIVPEYTFAAPPSLAVIPGTDAYLALEADIDIVFYDGFWYRLYEGRWYKASDYNGPWAYVVPSRVLDVLVELLPD